MLLKIGHAHTKIISQLYFFSINGTFLYQNYSTSNNFIQLLHLLKY